ncbi:KUP/HAK/KT family potassium transporter, partial [Methylobacterium organophilum]|nr:KUP/HAK/KT family potassium transporter [Methylobacterium organophilum]
MNAPITALSSLASPRLGKLRARRAVIAILGLITVALTLASVAIGYAPFDVPAAFADLVAGRTTLPALVLWELRIPRALLGALVGFSLGLTGAAMQGYLRNPLADPGILGISSAAALGAVVVFYGGFAATVSLALPLGGIAGASVAALLLNALAARGSSTLGLILAGVGLSSLAGALTALWFTVMALGGLRHLLDDLSIVAAFNPAHGIAFLLSHGTAGLLALGAVFLAVTGAEALYADMGHFGRQPIRAAWFGLVLPALALNYLGQGAMLLAHPERIENPFFLLYPSWALLPMVLLATVATVIASQAVITGTFSITQQAMQLGLLPRMRVLRTSETEKGQIYIPRVNWWLLTAVVFLAVLFKSSSSLAAAYGIAVTGDMVITACLVFVVAWRFWRWP